MGRSATSGAVVWLNGYTRATDTGRLTVSDLGPFLASTMDDV